MNSFFPRSAHDKMQDPFMAWVEEGGSKVCGFEPVSKWSCHAI
jgi:hypothetical protein